MMSLIITWCLSTLIILWISSLPIGQLLSFIWETIFSWINPTLIDFRTKFGEWAVITGATDGIGKEYAKELAIRHINLILISRNVDKLEKTKSELLNINPNITVKIIEADFSKGKPIFENIKTQLNVPIGILVNNVGKMYTYPTYLDEIPEDELWEVMTINVGATTMMTRLIIEQMKKRRKGAIINISSASEHQPLPLFTVYAATKTYIKNFSDAIRNEYSQFGITIQHLAPLFVNTKMNLYSPNLQIHSIFNPNASTYVKHAITTLGKVDSSSGYWAHDIQTFMTLITPMWIRIKLGYLLTDKLRQDYIKYIKNK